VPFTPHNRITLSGYLGAQGQPVEQFSMSLSTAPGGGGVLNGYTNEQVGDIASDLLSWVNDGDTRWPAWYRPTLVKVVSVNADGSQGTIWGQRVLAERAEGVVAMTHAPQVCTVLSLNPGAYPRRHKGRVFGPPPTNIAVNAQGLITPGVAGAMANSFARLITNLNNQPGIDNNNNVVVVASTFGDLTPVVAVRVGQRLDTLRSRARSIPEAYQQASV
jgi:hypothetical protein